MMEDIEFHFIELSKLKQTVAELNDPLETWTAFIRYSETLSEEDMATLEAKNPAIKEAHETLDEISMDSDARVQYDRRKSAIYFYEKTLEKKFSDGKLEKAIEAARKMLEDGLPLAKVMIYSGLSEKELKEHKLL